MCCHPEPFASLKGKLREGSLSMGTEMLRFAQHDRTDHEYYKIQNHGPTINRGPTPPWSPA